MKKVIWDPSAKKTVKSFSPEVKRELGTLLLGLQRGNTLGMPQSRVIRTVHGSAFELRIKDKAGIYRVFYVLFEGEKILIPHAFTKKTQKTPKKEIETAKKRLRRLINEN
jgi:phage-related protein